MPSVVGSIPYGLMIAIVIVLAITLEVVGMKTTESKALRGFSTVTAAILINVASNMLQVVAPALG